MSTITMLLIALGAGVVLAIAGFMWLNRNKPEALDAAEQKVRDFKK